jgi:hypothetical protein
MIGGDLFGVVEALEVIFTEESAVLGFSALRHALAEIHPKIVAPAFVSCDSPPGCHFFLGSASLYSMIYPMILLTKGVFCAALNC